VAIEKEIRLLSYRALTPWSERGRERFARIYHLEKEEKEDLENRKKKKKVSYLYRIVQKGQRNRHSVCSERVMENFYTMQRQRGVR